jgi:hypothetical protein
MKALLMVMATGEKYRAYARKLLGSAQAWFVQHDALVFTDAVGEFLGPNEYVADFPALGYPRASLMRYHAVLRHRNFIATYSHVFLIDADMLFVARVNEYELLCDGIVATEHPGYVGLKGTPETNPLSRAYLNPLDVRVYFCGGFVGGAVGPFLDMAAVIRAGIDADHTAGILARWHDESHLNRFLYDNPPAKILDPSFCYPDVTSDYYEKIWRKARPNHGIRPRILALEKGPRARAGEA